MIHSLKRQLPARTYAWPCLGKSARFQEAGCLTYPSEGVQQMIRIIKVGSNIRVLEKLLPVCPLLLASFAKLKSNFEAPYKFSANNSRLRDIHAVRIETVLKPELAALKV